MRHKRVKVDSNYIEALEVASPARACAGVAQDEIWRDARTQLGMATILSGTRAAAKGGARWGAAAAAGVALWCTCAAPPAQAQAQAARPESASPLAVDASPRAASTRREPVFEIRRYEVDGAKLVDPVLLSRLLQRFAGPDKRFGDIESALDEVMAAYLRAGITAMKVSIPEQTLSDGVVRLRVEELTVERVDVQGARHRQPANLRRAVPSLREGATPNDVELSQELRLANENPGRRMEVTFRPEDNGSLTGVLRVADRSPWGRQLTLDNTGTPATGRWRLGLALQHANVLDRDLVVIAQLQTSPGHEREVRIGALNLRVPWYGAGLMLDFSASASSVDSGIVKTQAGDYLVASKGRNAGLRVTRLLPRWGAADQRLSLGLEVKHVDSRVAAGTGGASLVPDVVLRPVTLTYALQAEEQGRALQWQLGLSRNLPGRGRSAASVFAEPNLRAGADPDFGILRSNASVGWSVGRGRATLQWNEQWTRAALLSAEQFGIGGEGSVRGVDGRLASGDRGRRLSLEVAGPGRAIGTQGEVALGWQVFADVGRVWRNRAQPGDDVTTVLASVGSGLRLDWSSGVGLRADAGRVVRGDGIVPAGTSFVHVGVGYGF
jgi:hemolysin activation/secretion protein